MSKRLSVILPLALALTLFGVAAPAAAHTGIESTIPADGETLTVLPELFSVTATEELKDLTGDGDGFALQITGPDGARLDTGELVIEGRTASTPAVVDAPGTYTLAYQVVGEDGHPVAGEIQFVWAPDGTPGVTQESNAADGPATATQDTGMPGWVVPAIIAVLVGIFAIVMAIVTARRRKQ